ncbi:MAG: NAD-dependent epimerase/dehydratase family protein, partial [Planctomycetaceae bacterium]|nr:NAD-dependent epimerase/dehydratase family protein [Planctomycetaceae bacterium]
PVNIYAETKRRAEEIVNAWSGRSVILRPRAVFGPGDTVLLPRIIRAAQAGRLPVLDVPDGPVIGDLIYVENLVDVVEQAANQRVTGLFNLTNGEPVEILQFLYDVFDQLNIPRPQKHISARTAMLGAGLLELLHRVFIPSREPSITRFGVHVFRYSKTFDIRRSLEQFGPPRVSLTEGLSRTIADLQATPQSEPPR